MSVWKSLKGISNVMFIAGLAAAVLASSLISAIVVTQVGLRGPQGPKGDKGDTGQQGPQGLQGPLGPSGSSGPTHYAFAWASGTSETNSTSFVDMEGMNTDISVDKTGTLVIMFSCDTFSSTGPSISVRALVDGVVAEPGAILVSWVSSPEYPCSYNFIAPLYSQGEHLVKIQWRVDAGEGRAFLRTLIVLHLPPHTVP